MKKVILLLLIFVMNAAAQAQTSTIDSLQLLLQQEKTDTGRVMLLSKLSFEYGSYKPDSSLHLALHALELSRQINFLKGEAEGLNRIGTAYQSFGNYPKALGAYLQAIQINEKINNLIGLSNNLHNIGNIYYDQGEYDKALKYFLKAKQWVDQVNQNDGLVVNLFNMGRCYLGLKQYQSAINYTRQAYEIAKKNNNHRRIAGTLSSLGNIYAEIGNQKLALQYYRQSIPYAKMVKNNKGLSWTFLGMAKLFQKAGQRDSALFYAHQAFTLKRKVGFIIGDVSIFLYSFYKESGNADSALFYLEVAKAANDSIFSKTKLSQLQSIEFDEKIKKKDLEAERSRNQNRIRLYALLFVVVVILIIAIFLYINNKQKQKVNAVLQQQKEKTEKAYVQLQATQAQLIQSEKMASLGELTAGIAHEIQNPLNFVNNFSEVNQELIAELQEEIVKGNLTEVQAIAEDIAENEQKINHHGKRADAIVKGMLQHSRANSGTKEPTDINALADEYLRLSYHGLRAKDKEFNAALVKDFAPDLDKAEVVPQDLGRVFLNLFNNAFYAVQQKKKLSAGDYQPQVTISTRKVKGEIEIKIIDNGTGMSEEVKNKIFQPFFTTKPTGQGTGLGLSMSYDIITKGHGGQLKVETEPGVFTQFIIKLPQAAIIVAV